MRWKYRKVLKGNILCIDDPMYHFHPDITTVQWYYGTKEVSYLQLLLDIVKKFMKQLKISAKDVTFIGSSGGGYSSLYLANQLDYSSAIAMNPQIVLRDWQYPKVYDIFKKNGIDLEGEDRLGRNEIRLTNKNSRFMILMNAASMKEYEVQFIPFFKKHGIIPKYGLSQNGNIATWVYATDWSEPHSAIFYKVGVAFADYLLQKMYEKQDLNELSALSVLITEEHFEKFDVMDQLKVAETEKNGVYKFFIYSISMQIRESLYRRIPTRIPEEFRKFLGYNYEVNMVIPSNGNIGYYIGEQRNYRYNIFYYKGEFYFRVKVDEFSKIFKKSAEIKEYLNQIMLDKERITRWRITPDDTLIISLVLIPEFVENQINSFIDLTLEIINKFFV